jgi:Flp pilus assembly protein TadD
MTTQTETSEPSQTGSTPTALSSQRTLLRLGLAALMVAVVFAIYWPVLRGEFVWDDLLVVARNPLVKGELTLGTVWFHGDFPLTTIAFWLQWLAWGNHPSPYHIVDVGLHAINVLLVWGVLARLKVRGAWLGAMLFAVHPVCVGSAGWISEQKNTLSLAFYLLSFWSYLRCEQFDRGAAQQHHPTPDLAPRKRSVVPCLFTFPFYLLSLAAFILALLSKTTTVMLPVVLLLWAWWRQGRLTRSDVLRVVPFFALSLAFGLMSIWFQSHGAFTTEKVQSENPLGRLVGAGWAVWFYLGKLLWPAGLNLVYPRWHIDEKSLLAWVPLLLLGALFAVCWRFRRGWGRHALFGLGSFVVSLFPALGFIDMYYLTISRVSDHFQYLPMIGPLALVAAAVASVPLRFRPATPDGVQVTNESLSVPCVPHSSFVIRHSSFALLSWSLSSALIACLCWLSFGRARIFSTEEGLWRETLAHNPNAWNAHNNLGCILARRQLMGQAKEHFEAALMLKPNNAQAHCNLGQLLLLQGSLTDAESHLRASLALKPESPEAHRVLGQTLLAQGNRTEALTHLRESLRLESDVDTRLHFALLLAQSGDPQEAVVQFRQVLALKPDLVEALNNLAWILATSSDDRVRDGKEAVRLAEHACQLTQYREALPVGTLAAADAEAGRFEEAQAMAQKAADLAAAAGNPGFANVNRQLIQLYRAGHPYHERKQ